MNRANGEERVAVSRPSLNEGVEVVRRTVGGVDGQIGRAGQDSRAAPGEGERGLPRSERTYRGRFIDISCIPSSVPSTVRLANTDLTPE